MSSRQKITQLTVTLEDGSVEVYNGHGSVHSVETHASADRVQPKPEDMMTIVSAALLLTKVEP